MRIFFHVIPTRSRAAKASASRSGAPFSPPRRSSSWTSRSSLDSERKAELLGYFERIPEITGIPVLYITHAADEAERLAKTVLTMKDGRIADIRTPA